MSDVGDVQPAYPATPPPAPSDDWGTEETDQPAATGELRISHLNEVLRAVRGVNQLIVHEHDEQRLLDEVCAVLHRTRGYLLIWIARREEGSYRLVPAAAAGEGVAYLESVTATWDDSPTGAGPAGTAIRTGRLDVCRDVATDPRFAPWRDTALRHGFRAVAAAPILCGDDVFGTLNVYADRTDFFAAEELDLLQELAGDIAYALRNMKEEALRRDAEAKLQDAAKLSLENPSPVLRISRSGEIMYANPAAAPLLEHWRRASGETAPAPISAVVADAYSNRTSTTVDVTADGHLYSFEIAPLAGAGYCNLYGRDVTEHRRAEDARRASEEKYRSIFETAADLILSVTPAGVIVDCNPRIEPLLGYKPEEVIGQPTSFIVHPEDRDREAATLHRISVEGMLYHRYRLLRKDGSSVPVSVNSSVLRDGTGAAISTLCLIKDITELLKAEQELQQERDQAQRYLDTAGVLMMVLDTTGEVRLVNREGCEILGYEEEELVGRNWFDVCIPASGRDGLREEFRRIISDSGADGDDSCYENEVVTRTGDVRILAFHNAVIRNDAGEITGVLSSGEDVTAKTRALQDLQWELAANETLAHISKTLLAAEPLDITVVSELVLQAAISLTRSEIGYVGYVDPITGHLIFPTLAGDFWDRCAANEKCAVLMDFVGRFEWGLLNKQPLLSNSPSGDPRTNGAPLRGVPIRRLLAAPALAGDKLMGQIALANADHDCEPRDLRIVEQLASVYAIAVERMGSEQSLRESESRFRRLAENAQDVIYRYELLPEPRLAYVSPAATAITGYTLEEHYTDPDLIHSIVHPDDIELQLAVSEGTTGTALIRWRRRDGGIVWTEQRNVPIHDDDGRLVAVEGIARDITLRHEAEERVREESRINAVLLALETKLSSVIGVDAVGATTVELVSELVADGLGYVWLWDGERNQLRPLAAPCELSAECRQAFFAPDPPDLQYPDLGRVVCERQARIVEDAEAEAQATSIVTTFALMSYLLLPLTSGSELEGVLCLGRSAPGAFSEREITLAHGGAQRIALALSGERARDKVEHHLKRLSLLNDITRAVAEREDLQSIYHVVLSSIEKGLPVDAATMLLVDPRTNTFTVAARGARTEQRLSDADLPATGPAEVSAELLQRCLHGEMMYHRNPTDMVSPIMEEYARLGLRSGVCAPIVIKERTVAILAVGRGLPDDFSKNARDFLLQLCEHVALAAHQMQLHQDLQQAYDDLRRTQQAVMRQERLRALAEMASGTAHDINNAISPVVGYADLLLENEPGLSERAREFLRAMKIAGLDVAQVVSRMREFYRQRDDSQPMSPIDVNTLVGQVIDLTLPRWKDIPQEQGVVINVRTDLNAEIPRVSGVESEIREALTNLVLNAIDAMSEGGTVTISTRLEAGQAEPPPSPSMYAPESRSDARVVLAVTDTGIGMDQATRQRCLEPFYSTKGDRGTGLGLAMVYGVVQRHNGDIDIQSAPGAGTTVRLLFPVPATAPVAAAEEHPAPTADSRRILCIDDESSMQVLIAAMLEHDGHRVVTADGGQAGLDAFCAAVEAGQPFDIVVTDLGMPHMDGREVARRIKELSAATPVVLVTGWGTRLQADGDMPPGIDAIVGKPANIVTLRRAIAEVTSTTGNG